MRSATTELAGRFPLACLIFAMLTIAACDRNAKGNTPQASAAFFANSKSDLRYIVTVSQPKNVAVEMRMRNVKAGTKVALQMPAQYAFTKFDKPLITDLRVDHGTITNTSDAYHWEASHTRDDKELVVTWKLTLDHRAESDKQDRTAAFEHPYLAKDHGMLVAGSMFLVPSSLASDATQSAEVAFVTDSWDIYAPWPATGMATFRADGDNLQDDIIAIGAWDQQKINTNGMHVSILFAPGQSALRETLAPLIEKIVGYEVAMFGSASDEYYTLVFGRPDTPGFGGSPKHSSMTLNVPATVAEASQKIVARLIAHEFFHLFGRKQFQAQPAMRFFAEGFTDYYAQLALAELGIVSWQDFHDELSKNYSSYRSALQTSPMSLTAAGGDAFFSDPAAKEMVYNGGALLAALLDYRIHSTNGDANLDDFMRLVHSDSKTLEQRELNVERFATLWGIATTAAESAEAVAQLQNPQGIDFTPWFAAVKLPVTVASSPTKLDLRANLKGTQLLDIDPSDWAYTFGLREKDTLVSVNGKKVATPKDVYDAWSKPLQGKAEVALTRDGNTLELSKVVPVQETLTWNGTPLRRPAKLGR